jgi:putative membrane protein
MASEVLDFVVHCAVTALSLWLASFIFHGIKFENRASLFISALLLGLANALIRPIVILLTIPLTIITFGFFLLVINALMMLMVSTMVKGFKVSGFWTAFFASIFIAILSFFVGLFIFQSSGNPIEVPAHYGPMIWTSLQSALA